MSSRIRAVYILKTIESSHPTYFKNSKTSIFDCVEISEEEPVVITVIDEKMPFDIKWMIVTLTIV
ncbi:hypothetical protein [Mucilaginibacter glaciei]|uniref:Uncharacterized protein n=1 Tax=Mucilaginibacter glaciei TaxID=2772109 RepID=A0A926NUA9_9SPHI|nr:hypothetical protein [Mucilaginibacter glaciei]MBD1391879.1 hypothetical protein [Mucilaginibacter glaciei]